MTDLAAAPAACLNDHMTYLQWHAAAERRAQRGARQVFCEVCQRWQWPDRLCAIARIVEKKD